MVRKAETVRTCGLCFRLIFAVCQLGNHFLCVQVENEFFFLGYLPLKKKKQTHCPGFRTPPNCLSFYGIKWISISALQT